MGKYVLKNLFKTWERAKGIKMPTPKIVLPSKPFLHNTVTVERKVQSDYKIETPINLDEDIDLSELNLPPGQEIVSETKIITEIGLYTFLIDNIRWNLWVVPEPEQKLD